MILGDMVFFNFVKSHDCMKCLNLMKRLCSGSPNFYEKMGDSKRKHNNYFELIYPRSIKCINFGTYNPTAKLHSSHELKKKSTIIFTVKKSSVIVALNGALICLLEYKTSCADLIFMKIGSDKYMYVRLSSCWPRKQDLNESHHQCSMRVFFFFRGQGKVTLYAD